MRKDNKNGFFDFDMDTNIMEKLENEKEIFNKKSSKDEKQLLNKKRKSNSIDVDYLKITLKTKKRKIK